MVIVVQYPYCILHKTKQDIRIIVPPDQPDLFQSSKHHDQSSTPRLSFEAPSFCPRAKVFHVLRWQSDCNRSGAYR
jgi:hypothetical protein